MARTQKTQWDFGELFSPGETRHVVTVSDLTLRLKKRLEADFAGVWVSGEISNFRMQSSGHAYFVLKDAGAQLSCVLFRGQVGIDRGSLRDGAKALLGGDLTVYEPRGQYQLRVTAAELQGIGALQAAFERLKQKLAAEGLFEAGRKRPIRRFPSRIGIITSPTGAALQDVLAVVARRYPQLELILAGCRVQGDGAASEIARAFGRLNRWSRSGDGARTLDVILLTRGGGSLEDLWAFNEEAVARAIAASDLPVVSAVGHEIDFTIADFVADLRAATPSAAAEILTQAWVDSRGFVAEAAGRLTFRVHRRFGEAREAVEGVSRRLVRLHPRRRLDEQGQWLDDLSDRLLRAGARQHRLQVARVDAATGRLAGIRPLRRLRERGVQVSQVARRLADALQRQLLGHRSRFDRAARSLALLGPQNILDRGYSITREADSGRVVRDPLAVQSGQRLKTAVQLGELISVKQ
ncbi:MAG: exodeoxyribonuclease VII large subunit [Pedosphaera sp.]|nr:exodeoxyribonuclease VII large subunit [Pedosphaera sp.]